MADTTSAPESVPEKSPSEVQAPPVHPSPSAFDELFIKPGEEVAGQKPEGMEKPAEPEESPPEELPPEELPPEVEGPNLLAEAVDKIWKAVERLAKVGLNLRAVVVLLHDANPSIPKKQIIAVLESLKELPKLYGKPDALWVLRRRRK